MEKWTSLLSTPKPSNLEQAQQLTYIKYSHPTTSSLPNAETHPERCESSNTKTIVTSENRSLILSAGTTGFRTWEAALHLGTFLSTTDSGRSLIANKRVLELGAGTGFLSFLCAKHLGAENVTVTDREPALIEQINDCIGKNGLDSKKIQAGIWEWGMPLRISPLFEEGKEETRSGFDIAIGADLVCFPLLNDNETVSDIPG